MKTREPHKRYPYVNGVNIYEGRDERCPLVFVDTRAIIKKFLEDKNEL